MTLLTITQKQQEILTLLQRFRFLNRIQIQALLKHKNKKNINTWLQDLNQKEYIERIWSDKVGDNMKPAIYYLAIGGIRYLKTLGYASVELNNLRHEKIKSDNFIAKHLLIAEIWLDLKSKSDDKINYAIATRSDMTDPNYKYNFLKEIGPDLVFAKISKSTKKYYLLEIFNSTLPIYSIRKKIQNYVDFYFSNNWEDSTHTDFPTVILICPDLSKLIAAKRYAKKILSEYDEIKLKIQFETQDEVKKDGITNNLGRK